nr:immunoglobulin heavy chain junction region [Mus musculus]
CARVRGWFYYAMDYW